MIADATEARSRLSCPSPQKKAFLTASRNEQNALIGLVNRVDGLLQGFRIICDSVAANRA